MSLSAIVYNEIKSVNIWNQTTLNTVNVCGDNLYSTISRSIDNNYLLLTDVPEFVDMNNITFHLQYSDSFSGALFMTVNNYPFVTLENALNEIFHSLNYKNCVLTIGMNTVAIMMPFVDVFKVFDSHSRDLYGMPSMSGYSIYYSEICKSELRRSDRQAAMCVENIFFKAKKLQMKFLIGQSQIALRKNKLGNRTLTAGGLNTPEGLQSLINHDDGIRFLSTLRGSPPYFERAKKDLFAMIRQLGPASLFCSFLSAETKWNHLLKILGNLIDHKNYSEEELNNLTWEDRCRLIQSDPVTCARSFDFQFNTFLKDVLTSELAPLGNVKNWFYRVEYQQRGHLIFIC